METRGGPGTLEINIEAAMWTVIERFGRDASFYYKLPDGQRFIMGVDAVFEVSGGHIMRGLESDSQALIDETWLLLEGYKTRADAIRRRDELYQGLVAAGNEYLEQWRQSQS